MKRLVGVWALCIGLTVVASGRGQTASQPTAPRLSNQQLLSLIATAKTSAEHQRLVVYYKAQANNYLGQAKEQEEQAEAYKKNPTTTSSNFARATVDHCEFISKSLKDDAAKLQELAAMHVLMAKHATQKP